MPTLTINGKPVQFTAGQTILQAAKDAGFEIPHYCYHEGLSVVASCRICLAEVWAPNPRNDNKIEPIPKLLPTCQAKAQEGHQVYTDSPRAIANQKAVMEYLLINHPLDCPVCDQSGECFLQDYSYEYGRGVSRFEEQKVKQPKKDLGPNVLLYSDRCIMCSRCVRFTREVSGTNELIVQGRGNEEQIDLFPGKALNNPIASNVIDICPVGALLDKQFLFQKRVWDLTSAPSIDGITASGDNIWIDHADNRIYRLRPRENMDVNLWWMSDEVRYGWSHVHADHRLTTPLRRQYGALVETERQRAERQAIDGIKAATDGGKRLALLVSPMLTSEEVFLLAKFARAVDPQAILGVGPIPTRGEDQAFPPDRDGRETIQSPRAPSAGQPPRKFIVRAEKCPNARGVQRTLEAIAGEGNALSFDDFVGRLGDANVGAAILTGNYPTDWSSDALKSALKRNDLFTLLIDTLASPLVDLADVIMPGATWAEKAGTFENAEGRLQAFEPALQPIDGARPEGQIALDLLAELEQPGAGAARRAEQMEEPSVAARDSYSGLPRAVTARPSDADIAASAPTPSPAGRGDGGEGSAFPAPSGRAQGEGPALPSPSGRGAGGEGSAGDAPPVPESGSIPGGAVPGGIQRPHMAASPANPYLRPATRRAIYDAARIRREMAQTAEALNVFITHVHLPPPATQREPDMPVVEL